MTLCCGRGSKIRGWHRLPIWLGVLLVSCAASSSLAATIGWAVGDGGTIVNTTDGGSTWSPQVSNTSNDLLGVQFVDSLHGIAVGAGGISVRTTDGGMTWSPIPTGTSATLSDIAFSDALHAVAVGSGGVIVRTSDGGLNWTVFQVPGNPPDLLAVAIEGTRAVAVGADGLTVRSLDDGFTWGAPIFTATTPAPPLNLFGVDWIGPTTAVAVGADGNGGLRKMTTDGGDTWSALLYIALGFDVFDVEAIAPNTLVAIGEGGVVVRSSDGGFIWTPPAMGPVSVAPFDLMDSEFVDALRGVAVGAGGMAIQTFDGGITWSAPVGAANVDLAALALIDVSQAAVPEPGTLVLALLALAGVGLLRRLRSSALLRHAG